MLAHFFAFFKRGGESAPLKGREIAWELFSFSLAIVQSLRQIGLVCPCRSLECKKCIFP